MEDTAKHISHSIAPAHLLVQKCTRNGPTSQVVSKPMIVEAAAQGQASHTQDHTLRAQQVLHEAATQSPIPSEDKLGLREA